MLSVIYAGCRHFIVMVRVIRFSVILRVVLLNYVMLSVIILSVDKPGGVLWICHGDLCYAECHLC
jgi:hypothetical protein